MTRDAAALLAVGDDLPLTTNDRTGALLARTYRNAVVDGRVVVRLVPDVVAPAEDRELADVLFAPPERSAVVGVARLPEDRFPGWPLVHDPDGTEAAVEASSGMRALTSDIWWEPGNVKRGLLGLAAGLAPHFLPSFHEQAGRAFLGEDDTAVAGTLFGRAREAEWAHGLTVDDDLRYAAFLEFARAGAVPGRIMSRYAKELPPFEGFLRLCVERTRAGQAPYSAIATDLRRLAAAAGLTADDADERVLTALLDAPALANAPQGFWAAYAPALIRLATTDPAVRGRLLALRPNGKALDAWLQLLIDTGAVAGLTAPAGTVEPAAEPPGGVAAWFTRAIHCHLTGGTTTRRPLLYALLEAAADRLRADRVPVQATPYYTVDLDLLDTAVAAGIPIATLKHPVRLDPTSWLADESPGRRSLAALADDERLAEGVRRLLESRPAENVLAGLAAVPAFRPTLGSLLDTAVDRVVGAALPYLDGNLDNLEPLALPALGGAHPAAVARLAAHDLVPLLVRTLRAGVVDELGWAALEEHLDAPPGGQVEQSVHWPDLVVRRSGTAAIVASDRVVLSHLLRIPTDEHWGQVVFRVVDGQLLVVWGPDGARRAYWSDAPTEIADLRPDEVFTAVDPSIPLPDGDRTAGGRSFRLGDRREDPPRPVFSDGVTYWTTDDDGLVRYNPLTGYREPGDGPDFLTDDALILEGCQLRPAPPGPGESPFGQVDGVVGWRLRRDADGRQHGTGLSGRAFWYRSNTDGLLAGALQFPGAEKHCALAFDDSSERAVTIFASDGLVIGWLPIGASRPHFAAGTPLVPLVPAWHNLRPRDPDGSAALRQIAEAQVRALLDGAPVATVLPAITHPALRAGVDGLVRHVAEQSERITRYSAAMSAPPATSTMPGDGLLVAAFGGLSRLEERADGAVAWLRAGLDALTGGPEPGPPRSGYAPQWIAESLRLLPAAMHRAISPATDLAERQALLWLLDRIATSGLLTAPGRLRELSLTNGQADVPPEGTVIVVDGRRLLVTYSNRWQGITALEYSPDGSTGPVPGFEVGRVTEVATGAPDSATLVRFVRLARGLGPIGWSTGLVRAVADRAGVSLAEAAILVAGLPTRKDVDLSPTDLGLGQRAVALARDRWMPDPKHRWIGLDERRALVGPLLPADPTRAWDDGLDPAGLDGWAAARGRRVPVDDGLVVDLHRTGFAGRVGASELLHGVRSPATCRWLTGLVEGGYHDRGRTVDVLPALATALPWLVYRLPTDDPLRVALPDALDRLVALLDRPEAEIGIGTMDADVVPFLAADLGLPAPEAHEHDLGPFRMYSWCVEVRTALLTGADDPALDAFARRGRPDDGLVVLRRLLSPTFRALLEAPAFADPGWAQDPNRSVPDLVTEVAAAHGLSADAATVYLQLLALPDPTDRNVARWTGWKPARLRKARAEVLAGGLVVEARRSRAGRSLVLPGPWLDRGTPRLPIEAWKAPLVDPPDGLESLAPLLPVNELFRRAWARVSHGDTP